MNFQMISVVVGLLASSNIVMTFARYGHLKDLADKPWIIAVIALVVFSFTVTETIPTKTS